MASWLTCPDCPHATSSSAQRPLWRAACASIPERALPPGCDPVVSAGGTVPRDGLAVRCERRVDLAATPPAARISPTHHVRAGGLCRSAARYPGDDGPEEQCQVEGRARHVTQRAGTIQVVPHVRHPGIPDSTSPSHGQPLFSREALTPAPPIRAGRLTLPGSPWTDSASAAKMRPSAVQPAFGLVKGAAVHRSAYDQRHSPIAAASGMAATGPSSVKRSRSARRSAWTYSERATARRLPRASLTMTSAPSSPPQSCVLALRSSMP